MIRLLTSEEGITDLEELPKSIYGLVKPTIDMDEVKRLAIIMGSLYLFSALFSFIEGISTTTVSNLFAISSHKLLI